MSRSLRRRSQRAVKSHRNAFEVPQVIEKLEQKRLLVGQVQAVVQGQNLFITGDESSNQVDVTLLNGNVVVRPKQGTRINGQRGAFIAFENTDTVPGSIFIDMQQGDDTVIISGGIRIEGDVRMAGDPGDDTLGIDNAVIRDDLIFIGGAGDDNLSLEDSRVVGLASVNLSSGDDLIRIVDTELFNTFRARGSVGEDSVVLDGADFRRHVQISLQDGDDIIDMQNSRVDGRFRVNTGRDDDVVLVDDSTFEHTSVFDLGAGADNFTLGEGDGSDTTPASGNVFKRAAIAIGGSGVDAFSVDIDNDFRSARRDGRFESDIFVGSTAGAIAVADGVADMINDLIDVTVFTASIEAGAGDMVFGSGANLLVATADDTITIAGTTDPGADIELDTDGDGVFGDVTATAEPDGSYSIDVPLVQDSFHTIDIRNAEETGETDQVRVQHVVGMIVRLETSLGNIDIELLENEVANTVDNFLGYFDRYGNNTILHRSVDDFVIQSGGFTIEGETISNVPPDPDIPGEFDPARSNIAGTLSMALSDGPDTGNSQWFVNLVDNSPTLDLAQHTVFGVLIGLDQGPSFDVASDINDIEIFDVSGVTGNPAFNEAPLVNFSETADLTGTVSIANGSVTAFGTGTEFTTELEVGDTFTIDNQIFIVNTINGDDDLTVTTAAQQEFTNETATVEAVPNEDNYVVFSDFTLLDGLASL